MSTTDFVREETLFGTGFSRPQSLGTECELIQRAAKVQVIEHIGPITEQLQNLWDKRDEEYASRIEGSFKRITIPVMDKNSIYSGVESLSMLEASLDLWPSVLIYAREALPSVFQEDNWDTYSINLKIEILCKNGPVKEENIHSKEGLAAQQELDSELQRLSDVVLMCIRKDPSLGGVIGEIEKPPKINTGLPWARKETKEATGQSYIFQGKQFDFTVQKIAF